MEVEESQTPQVEQSEKEKWYAPLTRVPPLSKYLAMVLFIALPFVGFWLGMEHATTQRDVQVSVSEPVHKTDKVAVSDNTSMTEDVSENHVAYQNEQYQFKLQYPDNWHVDDSCTWDGGMTIGFGTEERTVACGTSHSSALIHLTVSISDTTLDEYVASIESGNIENVQLSGVYIGMLPAVRVEGELTEPEGGWVGPPAQGEHVVRVIAYGNSTLSVFSYSGTDNDMRSAFDDIVNSFSIWGDNCGVRDQEYASIEWQIYKNEKLGFELEYPKGWEIRERWEDRIDFWCNTPDYGGLDDIGFFSVDALDTLQNETIEEWWQSGISIVGETPTQTTIDGRPAVYAIDFQGMHAGDAINYYVANGQDVMSINFRSKHEEFAPIYEHMLNSLRLQERNITD